MLFAAVASGRFAAQVDGIVGALDLEQVDLLYQADPLGVTEVARLERGLVGDLIADRSEIGPAVVVQPDCTTLVIVGQKLTIDQYGNMLIEEAA